MKHKFIYFAAVILILFSAKLELRSQADICNNSESITRKNVLVIFPCSTKRNADYGEVNFQYCAAKTDSGYKVVLNEIYFDADAKCNDLMVEKMLNTVFSNIKVLDKLQIKSAGAFTNIEVYLPKESTIVPAEPKKQMTTKNCKMMSALYISQFDMQKATLIMKENCDRDAGTFSVEKIKLIKE